ncbi:GNAT family N-acetyltransferase [Halalkalibacillus halophilus]|uniref:GNAT family N-acetyltransferase n=1 Tax=Halalkalibacillus halophilus TaxID=392827 RepID=UPI00040DB145|nr:GNAT family N-acetyltransferase [Halalkalibacillus halophilus]
MNIELIEPEKHYDIITSFRKDSFEVSFGNDESFDPEDYVKWVDLKSKEFPEGFVLFFQHGEPVGQVEMTIKTYREKLIGYIHLFYIIPRLRGEGLGDQLYQYALRYFNSKGVSEFHLRVAPSNLRARAFYKKLKMEEIGYEQEGKVIRMKGKIIN